MLSDTSQSLRCVNCSAVLEGSYESQNLCVYEYMHTHIGAELTPESETYCRWLQTTFTGSSVMMENEVAGEIIMLCK